jgi:hypothetical protein
VRYGLQSSGSWDLECENAFHLASTILGGRDIVEEFTAARIWQIFYGWAPTEIVNFNVNWVAQEVPFPNSTFN